MPEERQLAARNGSGTPATGTGAEGHYDHIDEAVMEELRRAIGGVEFGSVLVKIHQGEVVGIETSTKVRLKNK